MVTYSDILAALPSLQQYERDQLRKALDATHGRASIEPPKRAEKIARPDLTAEEQRVLNALSRFMQRRGVEAIATSHLATDTDFRDKVAGLFVFIGQAASNRQEENAMLAMGFELLYSYMQSVGTKLEGMHNFTTAQILLRHIDKIPNLINNQFPGYAAAGLLHWIFKKDVDDVRKEPRNKTKPARRRRVVRE